MGRRLIGGAGGILGGWFVRSWLKSMIFEPLDGARGAQTEPTPWLVDKNLGGRSWKLACAATDTLDQAPIRARVAGPGLALVDSAAHARWPVCGAVLPTGRRPSLRSGAREEFAPRHRAARVQ